MRLGSGAEVARHLEFRGGVRYSDSGVSTRKHEVRSISRPSRIEIGEIGHHGVPRVFRKRVTGIHVAKPGIGRVSDGKRRYGCEKTDSRNYGVSEGSKEGAVHGFALFDLL